MLAYTAVDGLRNISRDFDLDWQPAMSEDLDVTSRDWRNAVDTSQRLGRQLLGALVALLPLGAAAWLR